MQTSNERIRDTKLHELKSAFEGEKLFYTATEAKVKGLEFAQEPPEPAICEYCGATQEYEGLRINNTIQLWQPFAKRCTCEGAKWYYAEQEKQRKEQEAEAKAREQRRRRKVRIDRLLAHSGVQDRYTNRTFESFQVTDTNKKAYETAIKYTKHFKTYKQQGMGLFLTGSYGTGKTHLAVAIVQQLIQQGIPAICKTAIDILSDIRRTYSTSEYATEDQIIGAYKDVDLLVIDDLGKEQTTDWGVSMLYSILNSRYETLRPVIVTSNYSEAGLIKRLTPHNSRDSSCAEAMLSRLAEMTSMIRLNGADWRQI